MTDLEKIIKLLISDIKIALPCKITKLSGMYAEVKPILYDSVDFPVIPDVPICIFGSSNAKLKFKSSVGDIVTVFFTQLDLSNYLARGKEGQVLSTETFNLTNAFALPFNIHKKTDNEQMPTEEFEIDGDVKINGNLEVAGNIDATGIASDITAATISLRTHIHTSAAPGSPTTPPIP